MSSAFFFHSPETFFFSFLFILFEPCYMIHLRPRFSSTEFCRYKYFFFFLVWGFSYRLKMYTHFYGNHSHKECDCLFGFSKSSSSSSFSSNVCLITFKTHKLRTIRILFVCLLLVFFSSFHWLCARYAHASYCYSCVLL